MKKNFLVLAGLLGLAAPLSIPVACSNNPASPNPTPTLWAGYTASPTFTKTQTFTKTYTETRTYSPTPTSTSSTGYTATHPFTNTITETPTITDTPTLTPTVTSTITATYTKTATNTFTRTPTFVQTPFPFKSSWTQPNVIYPNGLAVDGTTVYVAEGDGFSVSKVQVLNPSGTPTASYTQYGSTSFGLPYGVAVDPVSHNFYVLDNGNDAVYQLTSAGAQVNTWGGFNAPEGIAVDSSENVYVADWGNDAVEEFNSSGSPVAQWGGAGTVGGFSGPSAVAVDGSGNVYVADSGNQVVKKFDSTGSSLAQWSTGSNSDVFGITVDGSGNVYVADAGGSVVKKYDSTGAQITVFKGSPAFSNPDGVVLSGGDVWVTDYLNGPHSQGSLQIFGP